MRGDDRLSGRFGDFAGLGEGDVGGVGQIGDDAELQTAAHDVSAEGGEADVGIVRASDATGVAPDQLV